MPDSFTLSTTFPATLPCLKDDPVAKGYGGFRPDLELGGYTFRYIQTELYSGTLVQELVERDPVRSVFSKSLRWNSSKNVQTLRNVEQFVYNLMVCQTGQQHLERTVSGANLWVTVPLREFQSLSRYHPPHLSYRQIRRIIGCFREHGWIEVVPGNYIRGKVTRIRPQGDFIGVLDCYTPGLSGNVSFIPHHEVLVLKDRTGAKIDYVDDTLTVSLREQVTRYNDDLMSKTVSLHIPFDHVKGVTPTTLRTPNRTPTCSYTHSPVRGTTKRSCSSITDNDTFGDEDNDTSNLVVTLDGGKEIVSIGLSSPSLTRPELRIRYTTSDDGQSSPVPLFKNLSARVTGKGIEWVLDPAHVQARRIFNRNRWDRGGRWYSAFQNIPGVLRKYLRIDGEPTVELDYGSLHIRCLYDGEGIDLHGDPYDVDLDLPRRTVKQVTNWMLNAKNYQGLYALIRGKVKEGNLDLNGCTPTGVVHAIRRRHPQIRQYFHRDVGIVLMKTDSDMVREIVKSDLCPLIVHDSFIVPASQEDRLREVMVEVYRSGFGVDPVVK